MRNPMARQQLQTIYSIFTEGLGTPPVVEARALLAALGGDS